MGEEAAWQEIIDNAFASRQVGNYNFIEISNLPKKIDARSLTSLIISTSKITPKTADVCIRKGNDGSTGLVALVEFRSERDAHTAIARLQASSFGKRWDIKIMNQPKFADPEAEMLQQWVSS